MTAKPVPSLPDRNHRGHKGTFGSVCVVGGRDHAGVTMLGAPVLAGRGALRAGVGLCRLCVPESLRIAALQLLPSAMAAGFDGVAPDDMPQADALVIGPGLGPDPERDRPIFKLLKKLDKPAVLDADALTALAQGVSASRRHPDLGSCVLTPHPGEYERLADAFRLKEDPHDPRARESAAYALAKRIGSTVVLKGAGTVVSDGNSIWVCEHGHPCMATGGTGDVLAGIIGGLLAQNSAAGWGTSVFDLARIAVRAHALAGEAWARAHSASAGMLAEELADRVPGVMWPDPWRRSPART